MNKYIYKVLLKADKKINRLLGGRLEETISARSYRHSGYSRKWKITKEIIDFMFFLEKDHCRNSYLRYLKEVDT